MTPAQENLQSQYAIFLKEDAKFEAGNSAAGTRSRKALGELAKACKARRNEITLAKNAKKEAKV